MNCDLLSILLITMCGIFALSDKVKENPFGCLLDSVTEVASLDMMCGNPKPMHFALAFWMCGKNTLSTNSFLEYMGNLESSFLIVDGFETASDIWDIVSNSNWDLDELSTGEIPVGADDLGNTTPSTLAQTTTNMNIWNDITSASVDFNDNTSVSFTDVDQTTTYAFDYVTVAVHEIGHLLHLKHDSDSNSPMYGSLSAGEKKRVLTSHDESVIAGMY